MGERVAMYLRVSTDEQGASMEAQEAGAREWAARQGHDVVRVYRDEGFSGAEWVNRPDLIRLQADVRASPRPWDILICRDLDRLGRDSLRLGLLLEALHDFGGRLYVWSTGEEVRPGPEQRALVVLKGILAEQERAMIAHRTSVSMMRLAERGAAVCGRPYGYSIARDAEGVARYVVNEAEAEIVREIFRRKAAGESSRSVALDLNRRRVPSARAASEPGAAWHSSRVREIAANARYKGAAEFGRKAARYRQGTREQYLRDDSQVVVSPVPAIVDGDLFDAAQRNTVAARGASGFHVHRGPEPKYMLVGSNAVCGLCGSPLGSTRTSTGDGATRVSLPAYVCLKKHNTGGCEWRGTRRVERLDAPVAAWLVDEVLAPNVVRDAIANSRAEFAAGARPDDGAAQRAAERVADLERRVQRLVRALEEDDAPDILANLRQRRAELADARREAAAVAALGAPQGDDAAADALLAALSDIRPAVEAARAENPGLLRRLLAAVLVSPIVVTPSGSGRGVVLGLQGEANPGALLDLTVGGGPGLPGLRGLSGIPSGDGGRGEKNPGPMGMSLTPAAPVLTPRVSVRLLLRAVA